MSKDLRVRVPPCAPDLQYKEIYSIVYSRFSPRLFVGTGLVRLRAEPIRDSSHGRLRGRGFRMLLTKTRHWRVLARARPPCAYDCCFSFLGLGIARFCLSAVALDLRSSAIAGPILGRTFLMNLRFAEPMPLAL